MKAVRTVAWICLCVFAIAGCKAKPGTESKKSNTEVWKGNFSQSKLERKDLTPGGLPGLTIKVPANASIEKAFKLTASDPDVATVNNSVGFSIWIQRTYDSLAKRKTAIQKNSLYPFKGFVAETKSSLIYRTKGLTGGEDLRFLSVVRVGGATYSCSPMGGATFGTEVRSV